ncbi:MAG: TonB-dependent receptor, partial [Ginsengibacter sp.]
ELEVTGLNDVVVVGYGTQRKSDLTGAISTIKADDFSKGVNASIDDLLKGKAAGVQVVQNGSQPGGGVSISIRGASSINAGTGPLFVIDGLPIDNSPVVMGTGQNYVTTPSPANPLSIINPGDIASIEVLKDASATAIYGARGANGVIMITTKKGVKGKITVNYNGYVGIQNISKYLQLMNAQQYKTTLNGIIAVGGGSTGEKVNEIQQGGTDWQKALSRSNAPVQNHELSFSGGNEKTTYLVSLNYYDQQGVVISSSYKRYNGRFNLASQISDRFDIGLHLASSYSQNDLVPVGFGFNELAGVMYAAYNFDPTLSIRDSLGNYEHSPYITIDNPIALALGKNALSQNNRTFGTIFGNYKILPSLTAKLNIGADINTEQRNVYVDKTTLDGLAANGTASILNGQRSNYLIEGTLAYDRTFDSHHLTVLAGATTQNFTNTANSSNASGFPSDALGTNNMGSGTQTTYQVGSSKASNSLLSYIGRVNYSFKSRYLLTGTFRADGSSRFGENNKFGYFPSVAAGWKISQEDFMKNISVINNFKLRASWGQTGNQEIGNYQSIVTFASGPNGVFNEEQTATQVPARLANPNLKWETTTQTDIGIDFSILNDRLSGSVDYYQKKTFDMLVDLPVPTSTGFNSILSNVGSIRNEGFEFSLQSLNVKGDFSWNSSVIFSTLKNKVLNLGSIPQIITGSAGVVSQISLIRPGLPLQSFFGYKIIGVWQKGDDFSKTKDPVVPGDLKYLDVNGDGTVNANDRVNLGNSFPKFSWSFGNSFSYKRISLDVFFQGVQGFKMLNNNLVDTYFPVNFRRNKLAEPYINRWTTENPSNKFPSFVTPLDQGQKPVNSYTVEDASYLRLQTATISYNFQLLKNTQTVYLTGQNLFTITKYDGIDPALNPNGTANFRVDFNAYPSARVFMLGIKLHL